MLGPYTPLHEARGYFGLHHHKQQDLEHCVVLFSVLSLQLQVLLTWLCPTDKDRRELATISSNAALPTLICTTDKVKRKVIHFLGDPLACLSDSWSKLNPQKLRKIILNLETFL